MFEGAPALRRASAGETLVLIASALVVLVATTGARRAPGTSSTAPSPSASEVLPGPLPSGAPPRGLEELPTDDERATGCHFPDSGFGAYGAWRPLAVASSRAAWRALIPQTSAVAGDGSFRLLVHFHGAEPVRKQLATQPLDLVVVALDAGVGSKAYEQALGDGAAFDGVVAAVEREVAAVTKLPEARARSVVISSWSAGYGAVGRILARPGRERARVDAVVLLDSLHASYVDDRRTLDRARLAPFLEAARAASAGGPAFFVTHTQIATPGYASTTETAAFLLRELGIAEQRVTDEDRPHPLRTTAELGRLWVRGYGGADRDAHCAELRLLPSILRDAVLPTVP